MSQLNMRWHTGTPGAINTIIENALQSKLNHAFLLVDLSRHLKQPITSSQTSLERRTPTSHSDMITRLLSNYKVIRNLSADFIARVSQLRGIPKLMRRGGTSVLLL
jgi:hypothetical protein